MRHHRPPCRLNKEVIHRQLTAQSHTAYTVSLHSTQRNPVYLSVNMSSTSYPTAPHTSNTLSARQSPNTLPSHTHHYSRQFNHIHTPYNTISVRTAINPHPRGILSYKSSTYPSISSARRHYQTSYHPHRPIS